MNKTKTTLDTKDKLNILVAAGGTGGHLFPALAVVEQLEKLTDGNLKVSFIGSPDRIEAEIIPPLGYDFHPIKISGLTKLISLKTLLLPFRLFAAIVKSRSIIDDKKIDMVIATGAYLSYPPGAAAHRAEVPLFLMESNVNPGKAIRMLSSKASRIFTSFDESAGFFPKSVRAKIVTVGNPVRDSIKNLPERKSAREKFELDPGKPTVLIFGGSLGALSLNRAIEKSLGQFADKEIQLLWQTGKRYKAPTDLPDNVKSLVFIEDMAAAYAAADLVVARSGATTVAELCLAGKASVLIPLPSAANNEQAENAKVLEKNGASRIIADGEAGKKLADLVFEMIESPKLLSSMAGAVSALARPDAAAQCAKEMLGFIGFGNKDGN